MNKKKFGRDFLLDTLDGDDYVVNELVDTSRWSLHYDFVFEYEGRYWRTSYRVGATESQDEMPWEYESAVECVEVRPVDRVVTVYETVDVSGNKDAAS